jgi:hypothetical protein
MIDWHEWIRAAGRPSGSPTTSELTAASRSRSPFRTPCPSTLTYDRAKEATRKGAKLRYFWVESKLLPWVGLLHAWSYNYYGVVVCCAPHEPVVATPAVLATLLRIVSSLPFGALGITISKHHSHASWCRVDMRALGFDQELFTGAKMIDTGRAWSVL